MSTGIGNTNKLKYFIISLITHQRKSNNRDGIILFDLFRENIHNTTERKHFQASLWNNFPSESIRKKNKSNCGILFRSPPLHLSQYAFYCIFMSRALYLIWIFRFSGARGEAQSCRKFFTRWYFMTRCVCFPPPSLCSLAVF